MPKRLIEHDPQAIEPRGFNWTAWLAELSAGETITASTWAVTGSDAALTLSSPSIVTGSLKTQVQVAQGTLGVRYVVTNHITTVTGAQDDRSFDVDVVQR